MVLRVDRMVVGRVDCREKVDDLCEMQRREVGKRGREMRYVRDVKKV